MKVATFAALLLVVAGCGPAEVAPPDPSGPHVQTVADDEPQLLVDFDDFELDEPKPHATTGQRLAVLEVEGGRVTPAPDADGGQAARFPSVDAATLGRLAAIAVEDPDRRLVPARDDFVIGADVMLTEEPRRTERDDGDNLVQRGLFGSGGQYKLQLDDGRPACRVVGDEGDGLAKLDEVLEVGQWYRLRCERTAQRVSVFAAPLPLTGDTVWESATAWTITGEITTVAPISIGAKVNIRRELVQPAPDQFNGILDNVMVQIDGRSAP